MKVGLSQINTTVGDIRGNLEKIRACYRKACGLGAELVVFPELAIPGYPAWDLLEQPDFIAANLKALEELARETREAGLIVGYAEINPAKTGRELFNAAALLLRGKIAATRFKSLLPTYDVFDEARYFEPARQNKPVAFRGKRLGITICEDAWGHTAFHRKPIYAVDPVRRLTRGGIDYLINISASPYHHGKIAFRSKMYQKHAIQSKRPLVFCNLTGGNDDLIFDGTSLALDAKGRVLAQAKGFEEDLRIVDLSQKGASSAISCLEEPGEIYNALLVGLRDYIRKSGFQSVLVGLSGGIDSALVAALAAHALGPDNVTGVSMPSPYSSQGSVDDARALAKNLGIALQSHPITEIYKSILAELGPEFQGEPGVAEQNIQARIRGNLLMALSNKFGAILLSTGNKSELSVGYCTLYGDMNGGLAVIADVPKTIVYAIARWINRDREVIPQSSIDKAPSAELKPNQKDQDDLPSYEALDDIMRAYVEDGLEEASIVRRGHAPNLVHDILERIDRNEYKRRQAPPVLKITPKAFGVGRRMPIARGSFRAH